MDARLKRPTFEKAEKNRKKFEEEEDEKNADQDTKMGLKDTSTVRQPLNAKDSISDDIYGSEGETKEKRMLPKGKVKEISIRYVQNYPRWVTFRLNDENMFYQSTTLGEIFMNQSTRKIDYYKIETTQKVMFLSPTHIKISGIIH